jgi:hypothetical protein
MELNSSVSASLKNPIVLKINTLKNVCRVQRSSAQWGQFLVLITKVRLGRKCLKVPNALAYFAIVSHFWPTLDPLKMSYFYLLINFLKFLDILKTSFCHLLSLVEGFKPSILGIWFERYTIVAPPTSAGQ